MAYFTFKDCVAGGSNVIDEWLSRQPDEVRAHFFDDFRYLANSPIADWEMPRVRLLRGEFRDLIEFRVTEERIKYRIVGFFGPMRGQVTLCSGFTHSQSEASQLQEKRRALRRKQHIETGEAVSVNHVI